MTKRVIDSLKGGRVVGLFGPRRSGKTTLLEHIKKEKGGGVLMVHGENLDAAEALSSQRTSVLARFIGDKKYLFIDEAQKIHNIGTNLKLIVDTVPKVSVLVSGSSSFELRNKIGEPLVGRSIYYHLYPFSLEEVKTDVSEMNAKLEELLIYGLYPQVYLEATIDGKKTQLESIRDGYLLRDILELDKVKESTFIFNLLRLIAFRIGHDVSYSELASNLNVNKKTVMRYLDLLEKSYVIFSHSGYSRNLRKEFTKSPRFYFWDNGIRNSLIANYNRLNLRDDVGCLWENFCMAEREKLLANNSISANRYFWRTYDQKEIDLVEERGGKLYAFEFKYSKDNIHVPKDFIKSYPGSEFVVVNKNNYLEYLTGQKVPRRQVAP